MSTRLDEPCAAPVAPGPDRRRDVRALLAAVAGCALLGVPLGLLWSRLAPRVLVRLTADGPVPQDLEGKASIGADGAFLVLVLLAGVLCGLLAWRYLRRGGPMTVVGLLVGGLLAARLAAVVGVRPGADHVRALLHAPDARGTVGLPLRLRAPWALVGWPVGALGAFGLRGLARPDELD